VGKKFFTPVQEQTLEVAGSKYRFQSIGQLEDMPLFGTSAHLPPIELLQDLEPRTIAFGHTGIVFLPDILGDLPSVKELRILNCCDLTFIPEIDPGNIESLKVNGCPNLDNVPDSLLTAPSLRELTIGQSLALRLAPGLSQYIWDPQPDNPPEAILAEFTFENCEAWNDCDLGCLSKLLGRKVCVRVIKDNHHFPSPVSSLEFMEYTRDLCLKSEWLSEAKQEI